MSTGIEYWKATPFRELSNLQRNFDKMLDEFYAPFKKSDGTKGWSPSCEVKEDKEHYEVRAELPGVPKDQIKIEFDQNVLTISGERKEEKRVDNQESKTHFCEVYYGKFSRSMSFPTKLDPEKLGATYENGVLTILLAKSEPAKAKQISIK